MFVGRFVAAAIVSVYACSSGATSGSGTSASGSAPLAQTDSDPCQQLTFAESTSVAEASGAAWWTIDGALRLIVAGDSGNHGDYTLVDPETGATLERGNLPLGDAPSDDIEGLASRDQKLYGLLAPGWMLVWERHGEKFELVDGAYPLGPVDLPDKGHGDKPPKTDGMVCPGKKNNCGRNYEGLCIPDRAHAAGPCAGFAAAKADGKLYCLVESDGRFALDKSISLSITRPGALADCAFSDDGTLLAASNLFDAANVYRIAGWQNLATAKVELIAPIGVGFPEVVAARGDVVYRMSDTGVSPSLMTKFRCRALKR
jgi:outer membrane protein assembly factor BamB